MDILVDLGYVGLFIASFLAATVLPFSSEVVFTALVMGGLDMWSCIWVATLGNFLGGMSCYYLGRLGKVEWIENYLRIERAQIEKFQNWLRKRGSWTAFFVFLPGIGDVIGVALGFLRGNVYVVAVAMFLGKFLRYVAWIYLFNGIVDML